MLIIPLKAFLERESFHTYYLRKTDMSKMSNELRKVLDFDNAVKLPGNDIVIVPTKDGATEELIRTFSKYSDYIVDLKDTKDAEAIEEWGALGALAYNIIKKRKGGTK